jgi:hypothetical protein
MFEDGASKGFSMISSLVWRPEWWLCQLPDIAGRGALQDNIRKGQQEFGSKPVLSKTAGPLR